MDLGYKLRRLRRWIPKVGWRGALSFEVQQSLRRPVIAFRHRDLPAAIHLRHHSCDISVFEAVMIAAELDFDLAAPPRVIVDAGANVGLTTLDLSRRFPAARILAIEPAADNVALLRRNVGHLPNVTILQTALWSHDTRLRIENPHGAAWAYRCVPAAPDDPDGFDAVTLDTALARAGLPAADLVKIDIEGAETELFRAPGNWRDAVTTLAVEIHDDATLDLIRAACPPWEWDASRAGEKLLLRRIAAPAARYDAAAE